MRGIQWHSLINGILLALTEPISSLSEGLERALYYGAVAPLEKIVLNPFYLQLKISFCESSLSRRLLGRKCWGDNGGNMPQWWSYRRAMASLEWQKDVTTPLATCSNRSLDINYFDTTVWAPGFEYIYVTNALSQREYIYLLHGTSTIIELEKNFIFYTNSVLLPNDWTFPHLIYVRVW